MDTQKLDKQQQAELARLYEEKKDAAGLVEKAREALESTAEYAALDEAKKTFNAKSTTLSSFALYLFSKLGLDERKDGIRLEDGAVERATQGGPGVIVLSSRQDRALRRAQRRNEASR